MEAKTESRSVYGLGSVALKAGRSEDSWELETNSAVALLGQQIMPSGIEVGFWALAELDKPWGSQAGNAFRVLTAPFHASKVHPHTFHRSGFVGILERSYRVIQML